MLLLFLSQNQASLANDVERLEKSLSEEREKFEQLAFQSDELAKSLTEKNEAHDKLQEELANLR